MESVLGGLFSHWHDDLGVLIRVLVAAVLSGLLGLERERHGKSAGLRTHMLVGVGAALFMAIVGIEIQTFPHEQGIVRFDPIRVIQGVVAGVGFLGAGTIFVDKSRNHVRGLTTAASIWTTTAIGLISGLGRYLLAALATLMILGILRMMLVISPAGHGEEEIDAEQFEQKRNRSQSNPGAM